MRKILFLMAIFATMIFTNCEKEETNDFDLNHLYGYWTKQVEYNGCYAVDTNFVRETGISKIHVYPASNSGYIGATFTINDVVFIPTQQKPDSPNSITFSDSSVYNGNAFKAIITLQYPFDDLKCKLNYNGVNYILNKISGNF